MFNKRFLFALNFFFALGCLLASPKTCDAGANPSERPDILFIFADDLCHEALSTYGSEAQTPNLDRLVRDGTAFTHAYNQGSWTGAVCVASRTMLNTGRFLGPALRADLNTEDEVEAGRFWSQLMHGAGYDTYFAGKWHVRANPEAIFDHVATIRPGMPQMTDAGKAIVYDRPKSVDDYKSGWKPWDRQYGGFWEGGTHWSEVLAAEGSAFLESASESKKPFFMYLAFNASHDPRQAPKEYVDRYPLEEVEVPENFLAEYPYKDDIGCSPELRDEALAPFPRTEYAVKVNRQEYFALIDHMDEQIGRILDALDASGRRKHTYIIFSADHGLAVGHHGLMGKQNMYEHSLRAPLIINGPDIPAGRKIDAPVFIQDIMPTALELAGATVPDHVDFKSLLPLIHGKTGQTHDTVHAAYLDLQRMVRKGDFKLIHYPAVDTYRLYNLREDPQEMHDLASDPDREDAIEDLAKLLPEFVTLPEDS